MIDVAARTEDRALVEKVLDTVISGGGEVFAEDVSAVINGLGISKLVDPNRVAAALERIVANRAAVKAFTDDPRKAAWTLLHESVNNLNVTEVIAGYKSDAEDAINLVIGYRVIPQL